MTLTRHAPVDSTNDRVVLLDAHGHPSGTAVKSEVHGFATPLHLAFSCYVVNADGHVLLTKRAATKRMWPSTWTNACCGHPRPGEATHEAVARHLRDELGLEVDSLRCAVADFAYRAVMQNGLMEHELCPVFLATVTGQLDPNPLEVDEVDWTTWDQLVERAQDRPESLSPWSIEQIQRLQNCVKDPLTWLMEPRDDLHERIAAQPLDRVIDPFAPIGARVDDIVQTFLCEREHELGELDPLVGELTAQIRLLISAGGKRLRPAFVYWGHQAAGSGEHVDVAGVAAAIEMLHTFALLHDDVMDRSDVRRGAAAAHVQFADIHRASNGGGDSGWFGASAAIVAGDLAFVWADQLLDQMTCDADIARCVRTAFSRLRTEVIAGQYLDIRLAGSVATQHQAANIALLKSGRYTVTRPLEIGAALAGADEATLRALRRYGDAAGVAFQLRDDVLGVFGDPAITGKSATDDLRDGKASLLLVRAAELADARGRRLLKASLGRPDLDNETARECRDVIAGSGALASIEALIAAHVDDARRAIRCVAPSARAALSGLAGSLSERAA